MSDRIDTASKRYRLLTKLLDGPATDEEVAPLIRGPNQTDQAAINRAHCLMIVLHKDGLVSRQDQHWFILPAGRQVQEQAPSRQTVRVFTAKKEKAHG